jgi:hypothetical protein
VIWDLLERRLWSVAVRWNAGWTQQEIANDLGLPRTTVASKVVLIREMGAEKFVNAPWDELDTVLSKYGRCARCKLLLPHDNCLGVSDAA